MIVGGEIDQAFLCDFGCRFRIEAELSPEREQDWAIPMIELGPSGALAWIEERFQESRGGRGSQRLQLGRFFRSASGGTGATDGHVMGPVLAQIWRVEEGGCPWPGTQLTGEGGFWIASA